MIFTILGSSPTCVFSLFAVKGAAAMRVNNTNARLNKPSRTWDDRLLNQIVCGISISFLWRGTSIRVPSTPSKRSSVARELCWLLESSVQKIWRFGSLIFLHKYSSHWQLYLTVNTIG